MVDSLLAPLIGGMLIGTATTLLMLFYGKIFGVSGIIGGLFGTADKDYDWRIAIILGFLTGGLFLSVFLPHNLTNTVVRSPVATIVAGLLVGFGTRLGSGCTSGHGICGISRFSMRSMIAVMTFMVAGALTVAVIRMVFGGMI